MFDVKITTDENGDRLGEREVYLAGREMVQHFKCCSAKSDGAYCLESEGHPGPHLAEIDDPEHGFVYISWEGTR